MSYSFNIIIKTVECKDHYVTVNSIDSFKIITININIKTFIFTNPIEYNKIIKL